MTLASIISIPWDEFPIEEVRKWFWFFFFLYLIRLLQPVEEEEPVTDVSDHAPSPVDQVSGPPAPKRRSLVPPPAYAPPAPVEPKMVISDSEWDRICEMNGGKEEIDRKTWDLLLLEGKGRKGSHPSRKKKADADAEFLRAEAKAKKTAEKRDTLKEEINKALIPSIKKALYGRVRACVRGACILYS